LKPKETKQTEPPSNSRNETSAISRNKVNPPAGLVGKPSGAPIIIVPKALSSDINISNIKPFLEEGKYVKTNQTHTQNRPKQVSIERISPVDPNKRLHYKVLDDANNLPAEEWDRVVAVFAAGQPWQFREWKYPDPVNLFQHARGFYIAPDDRAPDANVTKWNCKILKVNSVKNHVSTSACKDFWASLDEFVKYHRPQFDPSKL
jgi:parafibromin